MKKIDYQREMTVTGKIKESLEKKIKDSFLEFVTDCRQVIELEDNKVKAAQDIKAVASLMAEKKSKNQSKYAQ